MHVLEENIFDFGKFRLDNANKVLRYNGEIVGLPLKSVELLCLLVENRGEIVNKQEIFERVWTDSFVEDSVLTQNIYQIRKTFEEFGEKDLIKTVPRRGYIFKFENETTLTIEREIYEEIEIIETDSEPEPKTLDLPSVKEPKYRRINILLVAIVSLIALSLSIVGFWRYANPQKNSTFSEIKSIALFPLVSLSNDENEKALALGIKEKLLMNLGRIDGISVQNVNIDESELDKITNADAILLGNVQRTDEKIRVNLRFLRVSDKKQIWSASFDENQTELFKLQDLISTKITDSLALNLTKSEKENIFKRYTENADAYELYLKGRYYWNKRNTAFVIDAERYFRQAIEKDPNFALAYVGLADKLLLNGEKDADFYLNKALEIDPNLAEAYASRGFWNTFSRWDWEKAEADFQKSIELNPSYATAYQWYATLLMIRGRQTEAIAKLQRAIEIEPQSVNFYSDLGEAYYYAGDYENAEKSCLKALEIDPEFVFAHQNLADIYLEKGEYEKSIKHQFDALLYDKSPQEQTAEAKKNFEKSSDLMKTYQQGGTKAYWQKRLEDFKPDKSWGHYYYFGAFLLNKVGEKEKALDKLEKAVERREFLVPFINVNPKLDTLRNEPRFQALIKKMNLGSQ